MKQLDLIGKRFDRLIVVKLGPKQGKKLTWECKCDCGNTTFVTTSNLSCHRIKSCGCLKNEQLIQRNTTHNQRHTHLYEVWKATKQRCFNQRNKAYPNYGGRGVSMCNEWKNSFSSFYCWSINNGYQKGLTIDRIDNNGDYCPNNCRWADRTTQANNTRNNRYIIIDGISHTLSEWANIYNIKPSCVWDRLKHGWDIKKALMTQIKKRKAFRT